MQLLGPLLVSIVAAAAAAKPLTSSLLAVGGGPSEAGLYISPVSYVHTLEGPAFQSPSYW